MKSGYFKAAAFFLVLFFAAFAPRVFAAPPIDAVAGVPVFLDGKIWSESPEELKSRLKIGGGETKTRDGGILSCAIGQKIFGVDANEIKFEYTNGKVSSVKIVFFNKGDSVKNGKWNSQTAAKMRSDARELFKKLSAAFGAAENSHIGGGAAKIRAKQWNCPSATIRVAFEDKEFIIMQAVPPAALAEKPAEKQQASGKKNLADSVEKSANGDIVVNVPMVNQGAKGYCFPATVERLLLHNGLADIDMHKLADLFKTGVGGGTTLDNAADAISKIARANKLKFGGAKRDFSQISKNIDAGVPHAVADVFARRIRFRPPRSHKGARSRRLQRVGEVLPQGEEAENRRHERRFRACVSCRRLQQGDERACGFRFLERRRRCALVDFVRDVQVGFARLPAFLCLPALAAFGVLRGAKKSGSSASEVSAFVSAVRAPIFLAAQIGGSCA